MRLQLILVISFVFNSSIAFAFDDSSKYNSSKKTIFSENSKSFYALQCYAVSYIFLQYIKKSKNNHIGVTPKLEKQIDFYLKSSIINMKEENIDEKIFEDTNEFNLKFYNTYLTSNSKIDFTGVFWKDLHQCNIKFESLRNE